MRLEGIYAMLVEEACTDEQILADFVVVVELGSNLRGDADVTIV